MAYVEDMISKNKTQELINQLLHKFKILEAEYDFILCEGIRGSFLNANIAFALEDMVFMVHHTLMSQKKQKNYSLKRANTNPKDRRKIILL